MVLAFDPYRVEVSGLRPARAELAEEAGAVWSDGADTVVSRALELSRRWGAQLPGPGEGNTLHLWQCLAEVAAQDLTAARVLEPHLDALALLEQAGGDVDADGTWGVFAAEGPGARLEARPSATGWELTGRKPWCSLAGELDRALVTAWTGPGTRRLFAVELRAPSVSVQHDGWVAHGLSQVVSQPVDFEATPATPVGADGWYLQRPGFAWGGIGVAACWWGGAVGLARRLREQAEQRELDQLGQMHLGAVDAALHAAGVTLAAAATAVDGGSATGAAGELLALRARHAVRRAAEETLQRVAHALGPAPLAREPEHVRRVADLQLYLRQEHAERDEAALGRTVLAASALAGWAR